MGAIDKTPPDVEWPADKLNRVEQCPVCRESKRSLLYEGLQDRVFFCAPGAWTLYRCGQCGVAYLDPQPAPAAIGLAYAAYYTHRPPYDIYKHAAELRGRQRLKRALINGYINARYGYSLKPANPLGCWLPIMFPILASMADREVRWLPRPAETGRLLDLGCGNGEYLMHMRTLGWQTYGLDLDREAVASARDLGLEVQEGDLEASAHPEKSFDAITMSHVIEHIYDPIAALRACARMLKPGGRLWVATPNLASKVHERAGQNWRGLEPPRHLVLFTPQALQRACIDAGLEVERVGATAQTYLGPSLAIERGIDPNGWTPSTQDDIRQVREAQRFAAANPACAEELVVMARRPA
jgi:2-polyprenyl-3-methyl-5-hydroxy-6-metoxy-1,4-benzoquinol methylase